MSGKGPCLTNRRTWVDPQAYIKGRCVAQAHIPALGRRREERSPSFAVLLVRLSQRSAGERPFSQKLVEMIEEKKTLLTHTYCEHASTHMLVNIHQNMYTQKKYPQLLVELINCILLTWIIKSDFGEIRIPVVVFVLFLRGLLYLFNETMCIYVNTF